MMIRLSSLMMIFFGLMGALDVAAAVYRPGPGGAPGQGNVANLVSVINSANASHTDDIIDLGGLVFTLDGTTRVVNPDGDFSGLPVIASSATAGKLSIINGSIVRQSGLEFRFFYNNGGDLSLFNVQLEGGLVTGSLTVTPRGGAIYNANSIAPASTGFLTLENSVLSDNAAYTVSFLSGTGGAIYNAGTIRNITKSILGNNLLTGATPNAAFGGGIYNDVDANILGINQSSVAGMFALTSGGGIYNLGTISSITNSTISSNAVVTGNGGGIYNGGAFTLLSNSTIYGNVAVINGGGIYNAAASTISAINNNTISANAAAVGLLAGGGIYNAGTISTLFSNILASNVVTVGGDLAGTGTWPALSNEGYNLINTLLGAVGFTPSSTDILAILPNLGLLQYNGGPTMTAAILIPSDAINAGYNPNSLVDDQRGAPYLRVVCGRPDIGAYELQTCID